MYVLTACTPNQLQLEVHIQPWHSCQLFFLPITLFPCVSTSCILFCHAVGIEVVLCAIFSKRIMPVVVVIYLFFCPVHLKTHVLCTYRWTGKL